MDEESGTEAKDNDILNNKEFNRTVVISRTELQNTGTYKTPLQKIARHFVREKRQIEDIIKGVNVSSYTDLEPDTSAGLSAPLSKLDTRYSVLTEFAEGGLATVSVARDRNLRRVVAIKSLKKEARKKLEIVDAFISEAKVTAQLDHPGIIPIYGLTSDDQNGVHLSMKLVNGKTLRDYLRNLTLNYRLKGIKAFDEDAQLRERLEIFLRVCDAIAYAHHRNIMHRDIKPENILLGEFMEVYVVDWGLATLIKKDGDADEEGKISGTPRYFAPEVLRYEKYDARADIFSLGLILQELVTLQVAIGGNNERECMEHIVNGEFEPIVHHFNWHIDKALKAIIKKATAYWVADRYQSVSEMSEDLRRYMAGLSISACPDNFFIKLGRYSCRHWSGIIACFTVVLLFLASFAAYTAYEQLKISREMNQQRRAMNFIYNRTGVVANHLDITTLHIQEQLYGLSRLVTYLLSYNGDSKDSDWSNSFRPTMSEIGKTETGMFYSPYYKRMTSLDYGIYTFAPDADSSKCIGFMQKTFPVLRRMKSIVLGSKTDFAFNPSAYEKLKNEYLYDGFPVRSVFIGSTDGLKLLYPWRGNYPREIDPRKREWYNSAKERTKPFWGKPYMDFDSISGLSIPCSVPIYNLAGEFCGAVGLDLSINKLTESILQKGNIGEYVIEKAVINKEGETIFSSKSEYFNKKFDPEKYHGNVEFKTPHFRTAEIRGRILDKGNGYGTFLVKQGGKEHIYSYAHLEILDMYYVVVVDYRKLKDYLKENNL